MSRLKKIIDRGEDIQNGLYGIVEGIQEYNSLKYDIHQYFDDLKNSFLQDLESPENLPFVLTELKQFLPPEERE